MWKRTLKTVYGEVARVEKSSDYSPDYLQVYDALESVKYTVEYLEYDRENIIEKINKMEIKGVEPWEIYHIYETDSPGLALREIMINMFSPYISDIKAWITYGDKEVNIEIPFGIYRTAREMIQAGTNLAIDTLENDLQAKTAEVNDYQEFIKEMNAEKLFKEWQRERSGNGNA